MSRAILPAVMICLASISSAQTIIGPDAPQQAEPCEVQTGQPENCVRVLACIGDDGLWFDGEARGWDDGTVSGRTSEGITCAGTWSTRLGIGRAGLTCTDGTEIGVIYANRDNATSTALGHGTDSLNRAIEAWSGEFVLDYLTPKEAVKPRLLCGSSEILLSHWRPAPDGRFARGRQTQPSAPAPL